MPACFLGTVSIRARVAGSLPVLESGVCSIYSFNSELGLQKLLRSRLRHTKQALPCLSSLTVHILGRQQRKSDMPPFKKMPR